MTPRARLLLWLPTAGLGVALLAVVLRLAWLSDDAYITLRSVENLLAGHGPVWNVGERVQTFTHPLWFWLLAAGRALTGEHYLTTIALSVALTLAAALLLARAAGPLAGAVLLLLCIGSRTFGDYATSGLETPLIALLLVALARADAASPDGLRPLAVAWLTGLCATTRLDLLAIALPVLVAHVRGVGFVRRLPALAAGLSPLLVWTAFATFYYGSPFPITAYAKALAPGVPTLDLLAQGGRYALHAFLHDPVAMLTIAAGVAVGFARRDLGGRALALGALLSCLYVVKVGGDFMAGRFFFPAFVVSLCLLGRALLRARAWASWAVAAVAVVAAWLPGTPPFLRAPAADVTELPATMGIVDERRVYYRTLGLFSPQRDVPTYGLFTRALRRQGRERAVVLGCGMAGGLPYLAGEGFHFVDPWLCDPLLMRLPVADPADWRVGHFTRAMPDGYAESVAFGDNRIAHPGLARYYDDLRTALRGPLFAPSRLRAVAAVLLDLAGDGRAAYVRERYREPPRRTVALADLADEVPDGTFWFDDEGVCCFGRGGLRIELGAPRAARVLRVSVTASIPVPMRYTFRFERDGRQVGEAALVAMSTPALPPTTADGDALGFLRGFLGTHTFPVALPADLPGFDAILVDCVFEPWFQPAVAAVVVE